MINRKILCQIVFILYQIVTLVIADIEISICKAQNEVYSCGTEGISEVSVHNYCIENNHLLILDENDIPSCFIELNTENSEREDYVVELNGIWTRTLDLNSESITENNLSLIAIITCNRNFSSPICKQNEAIVKDNLNNYYYIAESKNFKNTLLSTDNTTCSAGNLINISGEIYLCLSDNVFVGFNSIGDYLLNTTVNEEVPFSQLYYQYILIRTTSNMFIKDAIHDDSFEYIFVNSQNRIATEYFESGMYMNDYFKCDRFGCKEFAKIHDQIRIILNNDESVIRGIPYRLSEEDNELVKIVALFDTELYAFNFKDHNIVGTAISDTELNGNLSNEDLSNTRLFYCTYAICTVTEGYIKYINNEGNTAINFCNDNNCSIMQDYNTECTENGAAFYNIDNNEFNFCIRNSENLELVPISLNNIVQNYRFFTTVANETKKYYCLSTNKNGNIVGYTTETGVLHINSYDKNNLMTLLCEQNSIDSGKKKEFSVCHVDDHLNGYYVDFLKGGNNLMYCEDSKCSSEEKYNGYFMNSKKDIIKCSSGLCLSVTNDINICDSNYSNYNVIKNDNVEKLAFCYDNIAYEISDNDYYYYVENVDPNSPYPDIKEGNGSILIKVSQYSVKQYLTDQNGVCYSSYYKNIFDDSECNKEGYQRYYCSKMCRSCTVLKEDDQNYDQLEEQYCTVPNESISDPTLNDESGYENVMFKFKNFNYLLISLISLILLIV